MNFRPLKAVFEPNRKNQRETRLRASALDSCNRFHWANDRIFFTKLKSKFWPQTGIFGASIVNMRLQHSLICNRCSMVRIASSAMLANGNRSLSWSRTMFISFVPCDQFILWRGQMCPMAPKSIASGCSWNFILSKTWVLTYAFSARFIEQRTNMEYKAWGRWQSVVKTFRILQEFKHVGNYEMKLTFSYVLCLPLGPPKRKVRWNWGPHLPAGLLSRYLGPKWLW